MSQLKFGSGGDAAVSSIDAAKAAARQIVDGLLHDRNTSPPSKPSVETKVCFIIPVAGSIHCHAQAASSASSSSRKPAQKLTLQEIEVRWRSCCRLPRIHAFAFASLFRRRCRSRSPSWSRWLSSCHLLSVGKGVPRSAAQQLQPSPRRPLPLAALVLAAAVAAGPLLVLATADLPRWTTTRIPSLTDPASATRAASQTTKCRHKVLALCCAVVLSLACSNSSLPQMKRRRSFAFRVRSRLWNAGSARLHNPLLAALKLESQPPFSTLQLPRVALRFWTSRNRLTSLLPLLLRSLIQVLVLTSRCDN